MFDDCEKAVHIHLCSNKSEGVRIQISNSANILHSNYRNMDSHFSKRLYVVKKKAKQKINTVLKKKNHNISRVIQQNVRMS